MSWEFDGDENEFNHYINVNTPKESSEDFHDDNQEIRSKFLEKFLQQFECLKRYPNLLIDLEERDALLDEHSELLGFLGALKTTLNRYTGGDYNYVRLEEIYSCLIECDVLNLIRNKSRVLERLSVYQNYYISKSEEHQYTIKLPSPFNIFNLNSEALKILTLAFSNNFIDPETIYKSHILDDVGENVIIKTSFIEEIIRKIFSLLNCYPITENLSGNTMTMSFSDGSYFSIRPWYKPEDFSQSDYKELNEKLWLLEEEYYQKVERSFCPSNIDYFNFYYLKQLQSDDKMLMHFANQLYDRINKLLDIEIFIPTMLSEETIDSSKLSLSFKLNRNPLFGANDFKNVSKIVSMEDFESISAKMIKKYC